MKGMSSSLSMKDLLHSMKNKNKQHAPVLKGTVLEG
jgi:hypothetical protein